MIRGLSSVLAVLAAASLTAACAAGPNYQRPQIAAGAGQPFLGAGSPAVSASVQAQDQWWRL